MKISPHNRARCPEATSNRKGKYQTLISRKRRLFRKVLADLECRRKSAQPGDIQRALEITYSRCLALCKISEGASYESVRDHLTVNGYTVSIIAIKGWVKMFVLKIQETQSDATARNKSARLSEKQLLAWLQDDRGIERRREQGTALKYRALKFLNEHAKEIRRCIPESPEWTEWADIDIHFFLNTGCIPLRVVWKAGKLNIGGDTSLESWKQWYLNMLNDYRKKDDSPAWKELLTTMDSLNLPGRIVEQGSELKLSLHTVWNMRRDNYQKPIKKGTTIKRILATLNKYAGDCLGPEHAFWNWSSHETQFFLLTGILPPRILNLQLIEESPFSQGNLKISRVHAVSLPPQIDRYRKTGGFSVRFARMLSVIEKKLGTALAIIPLGERIYVAERVIAEMLSRYKNSRITQ